MRRWLPPCAVLALMLLFSRCLLGQPTIDADELALEALFEEIGSNPAALEQALRERLAAARDDAARVTWTVGLGRLLLRTASVADGAVETLLAAEGWAGRETMDHIVRDVYGSGLDAAIASGALEATERALEQHPGSRALWISAGRLRAFRGDHGGALEAWKRAQAIASTPHGLRGLSRTYRQLERWEEALAAARTIPDLTVTEHTSYTAEPLRKLGRADEIELLADGLAARPNPTCLDLRALGSLYFMANRFDRTQELLLQAVALAGEDTAEAAKARYSLGSLYEAQTDPAAAREQYALAAEAGLESAQYWLARHVTEALSNPTDLDRMVRACAMPGPGGEATGLIPPWFEELAGLPRWGPVMVDAAEKAGRLPDLMAGLVQGLERDPDSVPHLLALLAARYRTEDFLGAADAARRLHLARPDGVPLHRVGLLYERGGDHARAAECFAELKPGQVEPRAYRWIGQCHAALGDTAQIERLAAALEGEGPSEWATHAQGMLWFGAGEWERAIPLLRKAPVGPLGGAHRELAQAYAKAGDPEAAIDAYRSSLRMVVGSAWWEDAQALASLVRRDRSPAEYLPDLAEVMREEAVGRRGDDLRFWRELVDSEVAAGRLAALIEALKTETAAHAGDGALWAVLGLAHAKAGDWEAAVAGFEAGAKQGSKWAFLEEYKLAVQKQRERSPAALAQNAWQDFQLNFRPALQAGDWDRAAEIACNLIAGFAATQSDQRDLALTQVAQNAKMAKPYDAFVEAVAVRAELEPENLGSRLLLAHCYYEGKQHEKVIETLTDAEVLFEADAEAWLLLGRAYRQLDHWADAADAWRKALGLAATDATRGKIGKLLDEAKARGF